MIDVVLHLDTYLKTVVQEYSTATYLFLFLVIFFETGLVVMPFLPGDSLLFAAGAVAATGSLALWWLLLAIFAAAVLGDTVNYHIGKYFGPKIFRRPSSLLFHTEHLARAQRFYEKHGRKTIILARFIPIIRTFAPFVAGVGVMSYGIFLAYNVIGAALWCATFIFGGFFFGNIPWVQEHFGLFILAIVVVSLTPLVKEIVFHLIQEKNEHRG